MVAGADCRGREQRRRGAQIGALVLAVMGDGKEEVIHFCLVPSLSPTLC